MEPADINDRVCSPLGSLAHVLPSPHISNSKNQQLSHNNNLSCTFRPVNSQTSSPLPSDSDRNHVYDFAAHNKHHNSPYQVHKKRTELAQSIEVLPKMERQKRIQKMELQQQIELMQHFQQIEQPRQFESLQKMQSLDQLEQQNQMDRLCPVQSDPQIGRDQLMVHNQQSGQEDQDEREKRYTQSQILYGQWLVRQRQLEPIPRPWTIWAIAIIDILSIIPIVSYAAYDLFVKPLSDPTTQLWRFFKVSVFTVIQLMMGIGLLNGLRSRDDSSTLWYCKMWIWCQSIFITDSAFTLFSTLILAAQSTFLPDNFIPFYTGIAIKGAYRLISLILLIRFKNKLKDSQKVFKEAYNKQQEIAMQQQQQNSTEGNNSYSYSQRMSNSNNAGGGDVIGPYVAVVLGL